MTTGHPAPAASSGASEQSLSLFQLMYPDVLANPYPLYHRLRTVDPVHWDPFLHTWVVTQYEDVDYVLKHFSAARTPTPQQLTELGLSGLNVVAEVLVRQMLFLDGRAHARVRNLAASAFTRSRVLGMRSHIEDITNGLLDAVMDRGGMDVIADLGDPLPAIVTAELLGLPPSDWPQLTAWSTQFAEVLGNLQHNPDHTARVLRTIGEVTDYFRAAVREHRAHAGDDLICAFLNAQQDGDSLTEDEVIANCIIVMTGGQETTTNLIGNGVLNLLEHPDQWELIKRDRRGVALAIEELLRFDGPIQYTSRLAPRDVEIGGRTIRERQAVIAVLAAANRDPSRFADPDRLDLTRRENRHLAFASGPHACFGAPLARLEADIVFTALLTRTPNLALQEAPHNWIENVGFRGLTSLPVTF